MFYNLKMKKNKRAPKKTEKGFSLVEFMLVIAILGFLLAVAVPVWDTFVSSSNLSAAVRQVATDIRDAQGEAMAELKYYGIAFDVVNNSYKVYAADTLPTPPSNLFAGSAYQVSWREYGLNPITLPQGIVFQKTASPTDPITFNDQTYGADRLLFQKNGAAITTGYIYIQNDKGRERFITVAATGNATVN